MAKWKVYSLILTRFLTALLLFLEVPLHADDVAAPPTMPSGLEGILKATVSQNGMIQEAAQDVEVARGQLEQARAAIYPKASAMILAAPIFEERGTPERSESNWNKWGPYLNGGFQIVQPLYTFGLIGNYQKAAESQVTAKSELANAKRNEVVMSAKEIYYGYLMATELNKLLEDLTSFLGEAVETAEDSLKDRKKKAAIKPHDVFRLKTALDDLEQKKLLAEQAKKTAKKALGWLASVPEVEVTQKSLELEKFEKKTLEDYLKIAKANRPELKALPAGIEAYQALADAKQAQSYPILFAGAFGVYNWSPVRERQDSVFANDPFNSIQGGIGVGFKFDLEYARHKAEAQEQNAQAMKLKATKSYAEPGIELQVKKAFWEFEQAEKGMEVATRRRDTAKKWFVSSAMGWSIGITPAKDLMEALEGSGLARKNYIETAYAYNLALARLTQAIGQEVTTLKY